MGLRDLAVAKTTIETPDGEFAVRGLSFVDLTNLMGRFGPQMAMVYGKMTSGETDMTADQVKAMLVGIISEVSDLVGALIALAADEGDDEELIEIACNLSIPVQAQALEAIFIQTFKSEAELKNFIASITRWMIGAANTMSDLTATDFEVGSLASASGSPSSSKQATKKRRSTH